MKLSFSYSKGSPLRHPSSPIPSLLFLRAKKVFKGFVNYKSAHHLGGRQRGPTVHEAHSPGLGRGNAAVSAAYATDSAVSRDPASPSTGQPGTARTLGIREGGGRGRSRESTPRECLAQGAFQQRGLQPGPVRRTESQLRGPLARPDLPESWNLPLARGTLSFKVENVGATRGAETRKTPLNHQTLGYLRPSRAPAGQALQLQCSDSPVRNEWPAFPSRARLGPEVRRW